MRQLDMQKRRRRRTLGRGLAGAVLVAGLTTATAAGALSQIDLVVVGAETEKSFIQVNDGSKIGFTGPASYDLDLDFGAGTARIENFFLPGYLAGIGVNFSLVQVPSVLEGTLSLLPGGLTANLLFPAIELGFVRDFGFEGTMTLDLSTAGAIVPTGCAGRSDDQHIAGAPLDLVTGAITLVGAVCPQVAYYNGNPAYGVTYDEAFRVILRGEVENFTAPVPEPGTILLVGSGLLGLFAIGRRRNDPTPR